MSNGDDSSQVALLLDFENLVIPFSQGSKKGVSIAPIVDFLEDNFGVVIFRRAYADWGEKKFGRYQSDLQDLGVEMIQVPRSPGRISKNSADILLTADAVECLLLRPYVDTFAIVSGDSDVGPLITKLKSHGKTVVVIGPDQKSTAGHVINLADRFKFYEDIVEPEPSPPKTRGARRKRRGKTPQQAVIELLRKAGEPVESANLKRQLVGIERFTGFNEKAHGFRSWTGFLKSIEGVQVVRRSDLRIEIVLDD
jgi:uncharacterized LabA/DUF88 family protein